MDSSVTNATIGPEVTKSYQQMLLDNVFAQV